MEDAYANLFQKILYEVTFINYRILEMVDALKRSLIYCLWETVTETNYLHNASWKLHIALETLSHPIKTYVWTFIVNSYEFNILGQYL